MRLIILSSAVAIALSGCGSPAPASKASPSEIFALRTECGKMGEAWLMRHPLKTFAVSYEDEKAKIFYNSESNRCWLISTRTNRKSSMYTGRSLFRWPEWASRYIEKEVKEESSVLYDVQTGADVMTCWRLDYRSLAGDCDYIKKVEASDL